MDDIRCAAADSGDIDKPTRIDAIRAWRFVLALVDMDDEAADQVLKQIGPCIGCLGGFASTLGGLLSAEYVGRYPRDTARAAIKANIDKLLDFPDLLGPPD